MQKDTIRLCTPMDNKTVFMVAFGGIVEVMIVDEWRRLFDETMTVDL